MKERSMATTIIEYIVSPVLVGFMGWIIWLLKEQKKSTSAQEKGLMLLLRRELIEAHDKYCVKGDPLSRLDYETICETDEAYKTLGGNGLTEKLVSDIKGLDIKEG